MSFFDHNSSEQNHEDLNTSQFADEIQVSQPNPTTPTQLRRMKSYYGVTQQISILNPVDQTTVKGTRAAYTKFNIVMLDNNGLYKKMGFFKEGEPQAQALAAATPVYFKTFAEAAKQGLIGELNFTMVTTTGSFISTFGKEYTTSVPFSYDIPLTQIGRDLKDHVFQFNNAKYAVKAGTIKKRKAKKSTSYFG
jgi:hypothetical protein